MKNIKGLLIAATALLAIGLGVFSVSAEELSDEEIIEVARDLYSKLAEYSDQEVDINENPGFNNLFTESSEEDVINYFNYSDALVDTLTHKEWYEKNTAVVVMRDDPYYSVGFIYYTLNENGFDYNDSFILTFTDIAGEWKLITGDVAEEKNSEALARRISGGYEEAYKAGRNILNPYDYDNYSFLAGTIVIEDYVDFNITYAYQNDDGSIGVGFWMANGSEEDIHIDQILGGFELSDNDLGIITQYDGEEIDETLKAGSCDLREVTIPADQVLTGMKSWEYLGWSGGFSSWSPEE